MMELYFAAVGNKNNLSLFEAGMRTIPMRLPFVTKDGTHMEQPIFGNLEEFKMYRFIFPKNYLHQVLKTLKFPNGNRYAMFDKQTFLLRKALNAKKIPSELDGNVGPFDGVWINNLALKEIGYKEDPVQTFADGTTNEGI